MRIFIIALIFAIFGVIIVYRIIKASKITAHSIANSDYLYHEKLNSEDSIIFRSTELQYLNPNLVIKSTFRNDIRCFNYRNICDIYYTKIDLSKDIPMEQFMRFQEEPTKVTIMHPYDDLSKELSYDFKILGEKIPIVDSVIFSLTGDGKQIKRICYNKDFISYYLPVSSFSLRYGKDAPTDIYFGTPSSIFGRSEYPLMIAFYKRYKSFYVVLVISDEDRMQLDADFLGKIMNVSNELMK